MIQTKKLEKIYKKTEEIEVKALKDVSLNIQKGELIAIIGPSGSGKSTLMHIIGCLDKATSGIYKFEGEDIEGLEDDELSMIRNGRIGFVFQSFNLLPKATALENVEMPLIYTRNNVNTKNIRKKALEGIERVGLSDRANHFPGELSGGQQQRVAIARALVNNPDLILAYEPTGNLDTKSGFEIMNLLQELNREGKTILVISHDKNVAQMTKRIINIKDGYLIGEEEVSSPKNAKDELNKISLPKEEEREN